MKPHALFLLNLVGVNLLLSACLAPSTPDQAAIDAAVATALAAQAPTSTLPPPTLPPAPTVPSTNPTVAPAPPTPMPLPPTTTPIPAAPICTVVAQLLNLRSGPGVVYDPIADLPQGIALNPQGFNPVGVPGGPWVMVSVSGLTGWVNADPQFITCNNIDVTTLPSIAAPPTPTPIPTPTLVPAQPTPTFTPEPPPFVATDPGGAGNDYIFARVIFPGFTEAQLDLDPFYYKEPLTFGDRLVFRLETYDTRAGNFDGDGIEKVDFSLSYVNDNQESITVYQKTDFDPSYCVFGEDEPCWVWNFSEHGYTWLGGWPVENEKYIAEMVVTPWNKTPGNNGLKELTFSFGFRIEGLPPTGPSQPPPTPTWPPIPPATLEPQVLVGTFIRGNEEVTFIEDGTWFNLTETHGNFTLSGNQITLIDDDNEPDSCPPDQEPGVYQWALNGNSLTFTMVNDFCTTGRIGYFTTGQWSKK